MRSQPEPNTVTSMDDVSFHRFRAHDSDSGQNAASVDSNTFQTTDATSIQPYGPTSDNSATNSHESETLPQERSFHGWTPSILQNWAISAFILCFLMILLALCVLEIIDSKHEGLATTEISKHYLWTYGPTAVLTVVAALWSQVEHRTKQLLPWSNLRKEPTPASSTLLREYITLSQPEVLYKSLKRSQWAVFLATTGSLLLKLLTVASTGLLTLHIQEVTIEGCRLIAMDTFTSKSDYDPFRLQHGFATIALFNGNISTYPVGTSEAISFSTIILPSPPRAANVSSLEVLTDVFHSSLECETGYMTITHAHCSFGELANCDDFYLDGDVQSPSCKTYLGRIRLYSHEVNYAWAFGTTEHLNCLEASYGTNSSRIIFVVGVIEQKTFRNHSASFTMRNQTLLSCTPHYTIKPMTLELDLAGNLLNINGKLDSNNTGNIQPFDSGDLAQIFQVWLTEAMEEYPNDKSLNATAKYGTSYPIHWSHIFELLDLGHNPGRFEAWFERDTIEDAARSLFTKTSAQIVKQSFMKSGKIDIQGQCHGTHERLRVNALSLRMMQAILVAMILIAIGIWFLRPKKVVSRDPGSIGGLTTVLARSPTLQKQLSRLGASPLVEIHSRLCDHQCQNPTGSTIEIIATAQPYTMADSPPSPIAWCCPISISKWFISLVLSLLALLLAGLEITFRLSKGNDGLGTAETNGYIHYLWAYSPALVMTCMQICVGAIAFSYLLVAPYHALKLRASNTRDLLLKDYTSQTAIQSVLETCLSHDWAALPVALSILLTPMLTLTVSGLFTTQVTQSSHSTNVTITNTFNANNNFTQDWEDRASSMRFSIALYLSSNVSLSSWTFDEFAIPGIRLDNPTWKAETSWNGSSLFVQLPVIRPSLDCTYMDTTGKNASVITTTHQSVLCCPELSSFIEILDSCPFGFGTLGWALGINQSIPEQCPDLCGVLGTSHTNYTAFSCTSSISEVTVLTELSFPSLEILSILPDESTVRPFIGNDLLKSTFGIQYFGINFNFFSTFDFDTMFQAIIAESGHNPRNWPMNDFLGEENFPRLAGAMQHVFRIIFSQLVDLALRVPAANDTLPITGTLTNPNVWRLYQNEPSTRILQALLAAIALCVTASLVLMDVQKLLPKNPCSIAAAASLLADSDILKPEITPEGAEWMSNSELKKAGVWDGYVFRLGWWGADGEEMRYGIDAGRVDANRA